MACVVALAVVFVAAAPSAAYKKESKKALALYAKEDYKGAVIALRKALALAGKDGDVDTRKYLVLALYNSRQKDDAVKEYRALKKTAPSFAFDPDEVLPETLAFFASVEASTPEPAKPKPEPARAPEPKKLELERATTEPPPKEIAAAPAAPREVKPALTTATPPPAAKRWHWYYLTPLGIGQFLAGSPVRGTILLLLQAGFTAMNVVGYVLWSRELVYADGSARDARAAQTGQTVMNVGFFGLIGSVVLGTLDGAFLEP